MYYNIKNNTIVSSLPANHIFTSSSIFIEYPIPDGSTTGEFYLWDLKYHIAEGFLPFAEIQPAFNENTEILIPQEIIISEDQTSASRAWTVVPKTAEQLAAELHSAWQSIRDKRNALLAQSDWTQLNDVAANPEWVLYRQNLRDIPEAFDTPDAVIFPDKPS